MRLNLIFGLTIIAITFLACNNPRMSERDRILLTAVKEFDSVFNDRSSNFIIAITKCDVRDTSHFYINEIYVIADIKHMGLKYVYLDFKSPIFSNFKFINSANDLGFEMTLKKCFPGQFIPGWERGLPSETLGGGTTYYLKFCRDSLIFKGFI